VAQGPPTATESSSDPPEAPSAESISRNAAYSLASQLTTAAFTAALTLYLARALGPDDFGVFSLAMSIGMVLLLVSDFGVTHSAARFIAESRGQLAAVAELMSDALKLKLLFGMATCVAMVTLAGPVANAFDEPGLGWTLRGMALAVFGQSMVQFYAGAFSGLARNSSSFRMYLLESVMELGASVGLVVAGAGAAGAAFGRAAGYTVGALVGAVTMLRLVGRRQRRPVSGVGKSRIAGYATAILVIESAFTLFNQIDVLVIGAVISAESAGFFQAPLRLITFLHYPGFAVAAGVAPRMAAASEGRRVDAFRSALRYLTIFQAALIAPVVVWADPIIRLLLGPDYSRSADVLRALAAYVFLAGIAPLVSMTVTFMGEARRRVPIAIGTVLINFVIDIVLIPSIGILGGAIGTTVAYLLYVPAHFWLCRRMVGLEIRPLLVTLGRSLIAAGVMAGVLALFGTTDVPVALLVVGMAAGVAAYVIALVATRELSLDELRTLGSGLRRRIARAAA
jgi:O-antigen/teichoic acid export membrane protein